MGCPAAVLIPVWKQQVERHGFVFFSLASALAQANESPREFKEVLPASCGANTGLLVRPSFLNHLANSQTIASCVSDDGCSTPL